MLVRIKTWRIVPGSKNLQPYLRIVNKKKTHCQSSIWQKTWAENMATIWRASLYKCTLLLSRVPNASALRFLKSGDRSLFLGQGVGLGLFWFDFRLNWYIRILRIHIFMYILKTELWSSVALHASVLLRIVTHLWSSGQSRSFFCLSVSRIGI